MSVYDGRAARPLVVVLGGLLLASSCAAGPAPPHPSSVGVTAVGSAPTTVKSVGRLELSVSGNRLVDASGQTPSRGWARRS